MNIINKVWLLLTILSSTIPVMAQTSNDGYDPSNPTDPTMQLKYTLSVVSNMDDAGTVAGSGKYKEGTSVTLKATTNTGYKFLRWTKDEETSAYSTSASFTYTTTAAAVKFTAVYQKLTHVTTMSENTSYGTVTSVNSYYSKDTNISVTATAKSDYAFRCWVIEGTTTPLSTNKSYTYTVGEDDVVLEALFDYVPGNPADPQDPSLSLKYNVKVSTNIEGAGSVAGTGKYTYTQSATISTSPNAGYAFTHWTKKVGSEVTENFSSSTSFSYPMSGKEDVEFIANYYNIAENLEENGHVLTLVSEPAGFCTFSITSGLKYLEDDLYSVSVTLATDVVFDGWYINGERKATTTTYGSYMGAEDVTLVAKCHYAPSSPDDPDAGDLGYEEIAPVKTKVGDIDNSGTVNVSDAVDLITHYLNNTTSELEEKIADVDGNGVINVSDAIEIIQIYLNNRQ